MRSKWFLTSVVALMTLLLAACSKPAETPVVTPSPTPSPSPTAPAAPATTKSRLDIVIERGKLICGANKALVGFGFLDPAGKWSGFDVDFCRAIAAALFNDPNKVEFRHLDAGPRFTALQSGEVDVLIRNTTVTLTRDTTNGAEFAPTTFYDGQGMMVRRNSGLKTLKDFANKSVCVQSGTTTEGNLSDQMRINGVTFKPVVYATADETFTAYEQDRCDGVTTDISGLISRQTTLKVPGDHEILPFVMSKEPLAPSTVNGDSKWFDAVKWIVYATIEAEEQGITSQNVEKIAADNKDSKSALIRRFLGIQDELGKGLGLPADFAFRVVKHVGNYGEIFDRNLGMNSPLKMQRGVNALWSKGGLLYSPPFR